MCNNINVKIRYQLTPIMKKIFFNKKILISLLNKKQDANKEVEINKLKKFPTSHFKKIQSSYEEFFLSSQQSRV